MRGFVRALVLATLALAAVSACAPQTSVVKLFEDSTRAPKQYKRLLIVDITSDHGQQASFEGEIAAKLRLERVDAVTSYTRLDTSEGVTRGEINTVADEVAADGILITHITSVDTEIDVVEGREQLKSTCRRGDPMDYFLYDHDVIAEPDTVKVAHTLVVISNLYDGRSHERIWTIQSTCFAKNSMSEALAEEASAIVRQLRIDELI